MPIYNCDYNELLDQLPDQCVDTIIIDPPYNKINTLILRGQTQKVSWDDKVDWKALFVKFKRVIKTGGTIVVFGQQPTYSQLILDNLKDYKYEYIWQKNNCAQGFHADKMPLIFTENIAVFVIKSDKKHPRTFNIDKPIRNILNYARDTISFHPTQKPIALMKFLVETYSNKGDLVLDCFAGSGSTLLAAKLLDRNYIGCERNAEYFEIAEKRLDF